MNLNIEFDANALAAPQSFRDSILTAASILDRAIVDNITLNISVGYGEINGDPLSGTLSRGGPAWGYYYNYSDIRSLLISEANPGDSTFNALPAGSSVQGQTQVIVWLPELKALGLLAPNDPGLDGSTGFGPAVATFPYAVGLALHELTHAMGRVMYATPPDLFDLFRFTSPGVRLFDGNGTTAPPAYFSLDGGVTDLADYGQTHDPSDYLPPPGSYLTVGDALNEQQITSNILSSVDVMQLVALGFHIAGPGSGSAVASLDFNHDGSSDVVWRNINGALALWEMTGSSVSGSSFTSNGTAVAPDASWSVAGISDFNGDGKADVLWRNTSGQLAVWTMSGSTITSSGFVNANGTIAAPDASWNVVAVGDLDGDGKSDIVWRSAAGALAGWLMNGPTITSSGLLNANGATVAPGPSWGVVGSGDFDGNHRADLLWRDNASGELALWSMNGTQIAGSGDLMAGGVAVRPDSSWSIAGIGDFNGDGHADLFWRNTNGTLAEWLMNGSTIIDSDVVTFNGSPIAPDSSWKIIEIGDFNHHGITDILWRNNSGALSEWEMNGTAVAASFVPTANGSTVSPDATWSALSKPTVYG